MSVTVLPKDDTGDKLFSAARMLQDIDLRYKAAAIDQALAQQHLQNAQTQHQLLQAQADVETQQAQEFTSSEAKQQRQKMSALDVGLKESQVGRSNVTNEMLADQMTDERTQRPMLLRKLANDLNTSEIHNQEARLKLKALPDMVHNEQEMSDLLLKSTKWKMISEAKMDPSVAEQMSKMALPDLMNQFNMRKQALEAGGLQIETMKKALDESLPAQKMNSVNEITRLVSTMGTKGAKSTIKAMFGEDSKEWKAVQDLPDDMENPRRQLKESDQIFRTYLNLINSKDTEVSSNAMDAVSRILGKQEGIKDIDPMQKMFMEKMGGKSVDPYERLRKTAKNLAEAYRKDPKTVPSLEEMNSGMMSLSETPQKFGDIPGMAQQDKAPKQITTNQGSYDLDTGKPTTKPVNTQGTVAPAVPGTVKTGQQTLGGSGLSEQSMKDSEKVFSDLDARIGQNSDAAKKTYVANLNDKQVKDLAEFPYDKSYTVRRAGRVTNEYINEKAANTGYLEGTIKDLFGVKRSLPNQSVSEDPKLRDTFKRNFQEDKTAVAAQEARYRVAIGELYRGYVEGGENGMQQMYDVLRKKFNVGPEGLTERQIASIKTIMKDYGLKY